MSDIFNGKGGERDQTLLDLLAGAADEEERCRLSKAWAALGVLNHTCADAPKPSAELERIFSGQATSPKGELMDDEDLDMIAAAGTSGNTYQGDDNNNMQFGSAGDDVMYGEGGDDFMRGNDGSDIMDGGAGDDRMSGGAGNDLMGGGEGNDHLSGGAGDDVLSGGAGDDMLSGGEGDDLLYGGDGSDTFLFSPDSGHDVVKDFQPGQDKLLLTGATSAADFSVETGSGNTVITFGDTIITLEGVSLTAEEIWAMQQQA